MTRQENMDMFRAILASAGIKASYGSFFGVSVDKNYMDYEGYFGPEGDVYDSKKLRPIWKELKSGKRDLKISDADRRAIYEKARKSGYFFEYKN